ncbi:MAG: DUF1282 family protein [Acholeplasmataceae bacterium]|jgi:hypothetical protein|nr:DUF1282 family protein [Acholeplasmataceae bacterium]
MENGFKQKLKTGLYDLFVFPLYILTHPVKGFEELKYEKKGKIYVAIVYFILMIVATILVQTTSGFLISPLKDLDFNIFKTALLVIVPIVLAVIGNWSVTSLLDGKGKIKEIFMVICYGLIPYILLIIPLTFLSNYLTLDEVTFYNTFVGIAVFLAAYMIFMGLLVIHEYGLGKTILTIIFTVVAIAVIVFIGILFMTLIQRAYDFVCSVYQEIILRIS